MEPKALPETSFADRTGAVWNLDITVAALKRVRALTGFDLGSALTAEGLSVLLGDIATAVDVIFALVKPEADERGTTDEAFGAALAGDTLDGALRALVRALVSFCPSPTQRAALTMLEESVNRVIAKDLESLQGRAKSGDLDREVEKALREAFGPMSPAAPASSGLTQAPSPSANSS